MHSQKIAQLWHDHNFQDAQVQDGKKTLGVLLLTLATMVGEITAGWVFGSMALLVCGWYMGIHVVSLLINLFGFRFTRRYAGKPAFAFGTAKVNYLAGFASSIALIVAGLFIAMESIDRFFNPVTIDYRQATMVAGIGLMVHILCAWVIYSEWNSRQQKGAYYGMKDHQKGHNLKPIYFYIPVDSLPSLLAIFTLYSGSSLRWNFFDPLVGVAGALVVSFLAIGLVRRSGVVLLDGGATEELYESIHNIIEAEEEDRLSDLHVWQVGPFQFAAALSVVTHSAKDAEDYRRLLNAIPQLKHITVEVHKCKDHFCLLIERAR